MTKEELKIAAAACCVGAMWNEYEGKEDFDRMVGLRVNHLIGLVKDYLSSKSEPEGLDETAKKLACDVCKDLPSRWKNGDKDTVVYYAILAAIAGIKWMAGQGVTKEAKIEVHNGVGWLKKGTSLIDVPEGYFKDGDTIIVQARRKDRHTNISKHENLL